MSDHYFYTFRNGAGYPAIKYANGDKYWYVDGKRHRNGGLPAVEYSDGSKSWWVNGELHRDGDLPAIEAGGDKYWFKNGDLHRDGGLPAVMKANGYMAWYVNGTRHRDGGLPALMKANGDKEWYVHGVNITKIINFQNKYREVHKLRAQKKIYFWIIQRLYRPGSESAKRLAKKSWEATSKMEL